ncbi:MAG: hypothetical protein WCS96_09835 [Victivallales bacterium]
MHNLFSSKIKAGRKKPEIIPRILAQLKYIQSIREKDIFCHFSSKDVVRYSLIEKIINAYSEDRMISKKKSSRA